MPDDPDDTGASGPHEVIAMPAHGNARSRLEAAAATTSAVDGALRPSLSEGQWAALFNLGFKQAGGEAPWINIADARALTDAGLADRTREGWVITSAGSAVLKAEKHRLSLEG